MIDPIHYEPPIAPIVRSIDDMEKDVFYWHDVAVQSEKIKSNTNLIHAEALYHISRDQGYKKLGFESMEKYVYDTFNRSGNWADKLIGIHKTFVIELNQPKEFLEDITFGKLAKLCAHVDAENVETILTEAKDMTQQQIDLKIKEEKGLAVNEIEDKKDPNMSKLVFKGPKEAINVISEAVSVASEEYAQFSDGDPKDVLPFQGLELICSNYFSTYDRGGDGVATLEKTLSNLEHVYNVKISYEFKERDVAWEEQQ